MVCKAHVPRMLRHRCQTETARDGGNALQIPVELVLIDEAVFVRVNIAEVECSEAIKFAPGFRVLENGVFAPTNEGLLVVAPMVSTPRRQAAESADRRLTGGWTGKSTGNNAQHGLDLEAFTLRCPKKDAQRNARKLAETQRN